MGSEASRGGRSVASRPRRVSLFKEPINVVIVMTNNLTRVFGNTTIQQLIGKEGRAVGRNIV